MIHVTDSGSDSYSRRPARTVCYRSVAATVGRSATRHDPIAGCGERHGRGGVRYGDAPNPPRRRPHVEVRYRMKAFDTPRERAQLLLVVLGIMIGVAVTPFAAGLLGALVLYVAVAPGYRRLSARIPKRVAALIIVVATAGLILLPIVWLVVIAVEQAPAALLQLQGSTGLARLAALRAGDLDIGARVAEASGPPVSWVATP